MKDYGRLRGAPTHGWTRWVGSWIVALLLVAACGDDEEPAGPTLPDVAEVPEITASTDTDARTPPPPPGPPCDQTGDCEGVFASLAVCEAAVCAKADAAGDRWCERVPLELGAPCDDTDPCTVTSACDGAGICAGGPSLECPERACTVTLGCSPVDGQCHYETAPDGVQCEDGNPCTASDVCTDGACTGTYSAAKTGCACRRDKDCPTLDACAGQLSCQLPNPGAEAGVCVLVPVGGVQCDAAAAGPCEVATCVGGKCVTIPAEPGAGCDDGNPCTAGETCQLGQCEATTNSCPCVASSGCTPFDDTDLCNGTLVCDPDSSVCVVDPATVVTCQASGDPCQRFACEPATGFCSLAPVPDGTTCQDGDACTLGDTCQAGQCVAETTALCGVPPDCGGVPCDLACWEPPACDPVVGCTEVMQVGAPCDDGLPCALSDTCKSGACSPGASQPICNDGNACTADSCVDIAAEPGGAVGCVYVPVANDCEDGDPCTQGDYCDDGQCKSTGELKCDDGNDCTTGFCIAGSGCAYVFNTQPCEDGDPCTDGDSCLGGKCKPGAKVCPCNEDANCTVAGGGTCNGVWHCIANQCVLETSAATGCPADSGSVCVNNHCDPKTGTCTLEPSADGTPCDDADPCTFAEVCLAGQCTGGAALECGDGNPCTDDECVAGAGCSHPANTDPCDDGDACTKSDSCQGGTCVAGVPVCACDADSDCDQPEDLCAGINRCLDNICQLDPSTAVECNTGALGSCLSSVCDPPTGTCLVSLKPNGAPCNDGDACTTGEGCVAGACTGGLPTGCDDDNPCTDDECDTIQGCAHLANSATCNDGDPCTGDEACVSGACVATVSLCDEKCSNELDDDGDALVDCADPECFGAQSCDVCAVAPYLQCGAGGVPGAVADTAPSQLGITACGDGPYADRIYRFTSSVSGTVAITLLEGAAGYTLRVLTEAPSGGCDVGSCKASGSEALFHAVAGKTYHVIVEKLYLGGGNSFVLSVTCAAPCVPTCAEVECGPDGCGGSCGGCDDNDPCTVDSCVAGECNANALAECCSSGADCDDGDPCTVDNCIEGSVCSYSPLKGCCESAADCDDGVACTEDACLDHQCSSQPAPGCCVSDAECYDEAAPCTVGLCSAGECFTLNKAGCCDSNDDCDSGDPCVIAVCAAGTCEQVLVDDCCTKAANCQDTDPCTHDACDVATGTCVHTAIAGCCQGGFDCVDPADPCVASACVAGTCTAKSEPTCCEQDADCPATGPCQAGVCQGAFCTSAPIAGCCSTDAQCDDGAPCTDDACVAGHCSNEPVVGCCALGSDCNDTDPCTVEACTGGEGGAGVCESTAVFGCCGDDSDCHDGQPCTLDVCDDGVCVHSNIPACCEDEFDCEVGSCVTPSCSFGACQYSPDPGCCAADSECLTGNPCVEGNCVGGKCVLSTLADCCVAASECQLPSGPCERVACKGNQCVFSDVPSCCEAAADCPPAELPCTEVECLGHACVTRPIEGCCELDEDCAGGASACAEVTCLEGSCTSVPVPDCCETAADCPPAVAPCEAGVCGPGGLCTTIAIPDCCALDEDCGAPPGPCSVAGCVLGKCKTVGKIPGCCETAGDCPSAQQKCKQAVCIDQICVLAAVPGCCTTVADCPDTPQPCVTSSCEAGSCALHSIAGCCTDDSACADNSNPCTDTTCQAGACVHIPKPDCCVSDFECQAAATAPCAVGECVEGQCYVVSIPGCCAGDEDCVDVAGPCAQPACIGGVCGSLPTAGCCTSDVDCPEDSDPCTVATCDLDGALGACTWVAAEGCCKSSADCPGVPSDPCTQPTCELPQSGGPGQCGITAIGGCAVGACLFSGFDDGSAGLWTLVGAPNGEAGWSPTGSAAFSGEGSLHVGFSAASGAAVGLVAAAPAAHVSTDTRLRFRYRLDVGAGDCDAGALAVELEVGGQPQAEPAWQTCLHSGGWREAHLPLGAFAGQLVTARFVLSTGDGKGTGEAWLDDVALSGDCALLCDSGCNDGNPCTSDACGPQDGDPEWTLCNSTPVAGCCQADGACEDGDPCTEDVCGTGGCSSVPIPGCSAGACLSEPVSGGLQPGWETSATVEALMFGVATLGSLSAPSHLVAQAATPDAAGGSTWLHIPRVYVAKDSLVLRFALRQSVGADCELGRLWVTIEGSDLAIPVHCGYHDWQIVSVPLPAEAGEPIEVALRFDAHAVGTKVELDDIRLTGACHPLECSDAADCDDGDLCTRGACDAGYACQQSTDPACCAETADCAAPDSECLATSCIEGTCVQSDVPGCGLDSCWFAGFDGGLAQGWEFTTPASDGASPVSWSVSGKIAYGPPTALHGSYATEPASGGGIQTATARFPPLIIGSGATALSFWYRQTISGDTCASGGLELWVNGDLDWLSCESVGQWTRVEVPLGAWVGTVVDVELRLRSDPAFGATGDVWVDDVAVFGSCGPAECASTSDCDDSNPCTAETCSGFSCIYTTNEVACSDGDACTIDDACSDGECMASPLVCYDDEPCTDDYCDSTLGCVFVPNAIPCDDGDPCTAGDSCSGGLCDGTPLLCKDFNGCTQDGCVPEVGCVFEPLPFGTTCDDGAAAHGTCWKGQCVDWQIALTTLAAGAGASDTRGYSVTRRDGPTPILIAGTDDPEGAPRATIFRVDQNTLNLTVEASEPDSAALRAVHGALAVGEAGAVVGATPDQALPALDVGPGLDLAALTAVGPTWFIGGDGDATGSVKSTVRRCKEVTGGWAACLAMPIVRAPAACGKQVPFHVRRVVALSAQKVLVSGASVSPEGDWVARVAAWDGNTFSDCEPLGVYSGEVYYDDPQNPYTLASNAAPPGTVESFDALTASQNGTVWAAGARGAVFRFDGAAWHVADPAEWPMAEGWGVGHHVRGAHAVGDEVHLVGDGVGVVDGGCRHGFYLHGREIDGSWAFDRLLHFGESLTDCGAAPFDHVSLRDVSVDLLTGDLYIVGWGPDDPASPTQRRGLVMRLENP